MVSSSEQPRQRPKAESNGWFQRPPPLDFAKRVTVPSLKKSSAASLSLRMWSRSAARTPPFSRKPSHTG